MVQRNATKFCYILCISRFSFCATLHTLFLFFSKLDMVSTLSEPRENSYIEYISEDSSDENNCNNRDNRGALSKRDDTVDAVCPSEDAMNKLGELVVHLGEIKTSKTFPSLCRVTMDTAIANLETVARLQTINYDGEYQTNGGDPVTALGKSLLDNAPNFLVGCVIQKRTFF